MEELFEVIIAIAVIAGGLIKTMSKANKVKHNAPGQAAAPAKPAAPAQPAARPAGSARPAPAMPTVKPTVQPSGGAQLPEFWRQISETIKDEFAPEKSAPAQKARGHEAVGEMDEGSSRECEHGSLGGSMAYEGHQEGREAKLAVRPRPAAAQTPAFQPRMSAQEMRRAVVMAEVLKRPQERMAEQARRWNAR